MRYDNIYIYVIRGLKVKKAELNPNYYLLALLGAHLILHVSRVRVNFLHNFATYSLVIPRVVLTCTPNIPNYSTALKMEVKFSL